MGGDIFAQCNGEYSEAEKGSEEELCAAGLCPGVRLTGLEANGTLRDEGAKEGAQEAAQKVHSDVEPSDGRLAAPADDESKRDRRIIMSS